MKDKILFIPMLLFLYFFLGVLSLNSDVFYLVYFCFVEPDKTENSSFVGKVASSKVQTKKDYW